MDKELMKTGTTTIGIVCKDGIVLAADRRVTMGYMIAGKKFEKIIILNGDIAITVAGSVSDVQLISKIIKAQLNLDTIRRNRKPSVKEAANLLGTLVYSNIRKFSPIPGITGFLMGGRDDKGYHLYVIEIDGSVMEHEDYFSDGSGSVFALGVLENNYVKEMSIDDGVKLAIRALNAALQRDIGSGSGYDIVTITKDGAKKILEKEIKLTL